LVLTDDQGRVGVAEFTIAPRTLTVDPAITCIGYTLTVTGTGYPAANSKVGADAIPAVAIKYTFSGETRTVANILPDASGAIVGTFSVPVNTDIPSTNSVTASFTYFAADGIAATETTAAKHVVPRAFVSTEPSSGQPGTGVDIV
jgi:hypothetical protein